MFSFSGTNCSMAAGLPYAIGAQAAYPGRQVVVFTGDGSLTMQLGDFLTCVQHELPVKIVVIKNNTLGLIKWEQMVFLGNPEYGVNMAPLDFVKFAEACGARGIRIDDPARCREQLAEALSWDGPAIIECVVDQHEPPYPGQGQEGPGHQAGRRRCARARRTAAASPCRWSGTCSTNPPSTPARRTPSPGPVGKAAAKIAGKLQGDDRTRVLRPTPGGHHATRPARLAAAARRRRPGGHHSGTAA